MELIKEYFPKLDQKQLDQFEQLDSLYREWNDKINVISRKDIDNLYVHHVLHSLTIAKYIQFVPGTKILDLGAGGGFPSVPLAIFFPDVQFTAIDGTKKKIRVIQEVAEAAGIENITPIHVRSEEHKGKYDFVVSRAVAKIDQLKIWTQNLIDMENHINSIPNGLIALKGGNIKTESKLLKKKDYFEHVPLTTLINQPYYEEKYLMYLQR